VSEPKPEGALCHVLLRRRRRNLDWLSDFVKRGFSSLTAGRCRPPHQLTRLVPIFCCPIWCFDGQRRRADWSARRPGSAMTAASVESAIEA
jgi:hypothetical protein